MQKIVFQNSFRHPLFSILVLSMISMGCLFISQALAVVIVQFVFQLTEAQILQLFSNNSTNLPNAKGIMLFIQGVSLLFGLGAGAWLHLQFIEKQRIRILNPSPLSQPKLLGYVFIGILMFLPALGYVVELNKELQFPAFLANFERFARQNEDKLAELTKMLVKIESVGDFIAITLVIAVIPALSEELFFRGMLQNYLHKWFKNEHLAIWTGAIIFSAIHFQFFGFFPRMLLGAVLGYWYFWSGNLWFSIFGHFLNNFISVLTIFLYQKNIVKVDLEEQGAISPILALLSAMMLILSLYFFKKEFQKSKSLPL
jgi:uncharacterized protein